MDVTLTLRMNLEIYTAKKTKHEDEKPLFNVKQVGNGPSRRSMLKNRGLKYAKEHCRIVIKFTEPKITRRDTIKLKIRFSTNSKPRKTLIFIFWIKSHSAERTEKRSFTCAKHFFPRRKLLKSEMGAV